MKYFQLVNVPSWELPKGQSCEHDGQNAQMTPWMTSSPDACFILLNRSIDSNSDDPVLKM
jgi:hypothetical protein